MKKAIFLDRDGVINKNREDYVKNWEEFIFLPSVLEAIKILTQQKFLIFIITNQSCIGRGIISKEDLEVIHKKMLEKIVNAEGKITKIYYCPHKPEDNCDCRKPKPGMFLKAAQEFDIDLTETYFIGDNITDALAAKNAGCKFIFVETGKNTKDDLKSYQPEFVGKNLLKAIKYVLSK